MMSKSKLPDTVLSPLQVKDMIVDGHVIVLLNERVLQLDSWLKLHPGGDKVILHVNGKDATDEINAFHSKGTKAMMQKYQIGRVEKPWINFVPPIQSGESPAAKIYGTMTMNTEMETWNSIGPDKLPNGQVQERNKLPASPPLTPSSLEQFQIYMAPTYIEAETRKAISLDLAKYPSLDSANQTDIMDQYRSLDAALHASGLYRCNYASYLFDAFRCCTLLFLMITFLRWECYTLSAIFLGGFWHQLVFVVHDAGHMGITHNWHIDTMIGMSMANFIGGLSLSWWKHNHNIHHVVTNAPEHDPDIEHMPFLAVSHRFFTSLRSTYYDRVMEYTPVAQLMMHYQPYLYYVLLAFGRFNLYVLSWNHLLFGSFPPKLRWHRSFETLGELVFWYWFGYQILYLSIPTWSSRLSFLLVSHMVTMPLHVQFSVSHFAMSTTDLGPTESFPQKMLRTTMDVDCPPWLDFLHGGLQFQAIHHLFPRLPRYNLRRAQVLVREFCRETGIPYALYGFVESNGKVIGRLGEVSRQAAIFAKCQEVIVRDTSVFGDL